MLEEMIRNKEVILRAAAAAKWKTDRATQYVDRRLGGDQRIYDKRNMFNLAALIIDVSGVPENEREEYFDREVEKIFDAYEGLSDRKPIIKSMYDNVCTDENIDWSDERQVERLLTSIQINQALSTMAQDFPADMLALYPTHEERRRVDNIVAESDMFYMRISGQLVQLDFKAEIEELIPIGLTQKGCTYGSPSNQVETEIGRAVNTADANGSDTIILDSTVNENSKNYFFGKPIAMYHSSVDGVFDEDEYAKNYFKLLASGCKHSALEQLMINTVERADDEAEFDSGSLLFINGKSINDLRNELRANNRERGNFYVENLLGKMFRDALTDGKSVVSLMRMDYSADGKISFKHQDVKADLDKLNKVDREENHHNIFRRFLDWTGIWKIQRFPTNAQRDAAQAKLKNDPKIQNALRAAEDNVVKIYNSIRQDRAGAKNLVHTIPKLERVEAEPSRQIEEPTTSKDAVREHIPGIELDNEKNVSVEPPKEINAQVTTKEPQTK